MGLGKVLTRSTEITMKDTVSGATAVFTVTDNIAPNWASSDAYRDRKSVV